MNTVFKYFLLTFILSFSNTKASDENLSDVKSWDAYWGECIEAIRIPLSDENLSNITQLHDNTKYDFSGIKNAPNALINVAKFFSGCVVGGLWESPVEMIKFVWGVLKWILTNQYPGYHKAYQQASELGASVKLYLVNEYDKAYEQASYPLKSLKAANAVSGIIVTMLYNKIEQVLYKKYKKFGSLSEWERGREICKAAADFIIPPTAALTFFKTAFKAKKFKEIEGVKTPAETPKTPTETPKTPTTIPFSERVPKLTDDDIRKLDVKQTFFVYMQDFTKEQVQALKPGQIRRLDMSHPDIQKRIKDFTEEQVQALKPDQIRRLDMSHPDIQERIKDFTEEQVQALTPNQIGAINPIEIIMMPQTQLSRFNPVRIRKLIHYHIRKLDINQYFFIYMRHFTQKQIQKLTPDQIRRLDISHPDIQKRIKDFTEEQVQALTPNQIGAIDIQYMRHFTKKQIQALTPDQIRRLDISHPNIHKIIQDFTGRQIETLTPNQIGAIDIPTIIEMQPGQLNRFNSEQVRALSQKKVDMLNFRESRLTESQVTKPSIDMKDLTAEKFTFLFDSPIKIRALKAEQIKAFKADHISSLTPSQIRSFSPEQIAEFNPNMMQHFSPEQFKIFDKQQISNLTTNQANALSESQLNTIRHTLREIIMDIKNGHGP